MSRRDAEDAKGEGGQQEPEEGLNRLTEAMIGAAIEVHRVLGPGFLEALYEQALCLELAERAISFARQVGVEVFYKGTQIGEARMDLVVDGRLLVELKATEGYASTHLAQVLSYLKATRLTLGLLINFNVHSLRHGLRQVVLTPTPQSSASSASPRLSPKLSTH